jgi:hypothetical protein
MAKIKKTKRDIALEKAIKTLNIPTLETRYWDRHDFHEVAIWNVHKALEDIYDAGYEAGLTKTST